MPVDCLPDNPDLERLKAHAKALRDLVRAGVDGSIDLVRDHHPRLADLTAGTPAATSFKLADAQLTVARHYDFASWAKLRQYVQLVNRLSRSPHQEPGGGPLADDEARADELLRLACLNYGTDTPARWAQADRLLVEHPHLATLSIYTAAATGAVEATRALLDRDPEAADRDGGPFAWPPLLYLTYSRLEPRPGGDPVVVAGLLLSAGADPNAGYLWEGLPSPFTALTGVFGRGEQGAPPHREELPLARLLLSAGAEANDSQTIYNRGAGDVAHDDTEFLELLLDHGLGRGDGGPWRRMLAHGHQTPGEIVAEALQHAAESGLEQRTRLLLARGVDPNSPGTHPGYEGRSPYEGAVLNGNLAIAELLAAAGADPSTVDPLSRFIGSCLAGDRRAVHAALIDDAQLLPVVLGQRADLVERAAELGRAEAIRLLADLGFDVNARHRTTALHEAAQRGDLELATLLVELGADPDIVDTEFDSPPAGWARHGGHIEVAEYLERLARSDAGSGRWT
jgi:hypothetical protein